MYLIGITLVTLLAVGAATVQAALVNVSLDPTNWEKTGQTTLGTSGGSWEVAGDGLKFYANGHRSGTTIQSDTRGDFTNGGSANIKWMVSANSYMWVYAGLGLLGEDVGYVNQVGVATTHDSTGWSHLGSTIVSSNTWYYTTIDINADHNFTATTYLDGYGTNLFSQRSGTINDLLWNSMNNAGIHLEIGDNYDSLAWMKVGEASFNAAAPVPVPTTIFLLGSGVLWLAGVSRKKK